MKYRRMVLAATALLATAALGINAHADVYNNQSANPSTTRIVLQQTQPENQQAAYPIQTVTSTKQSTEQTPTVTVPAAANNSRPQNGWYQDPQEGSWYFYQNGQAFNQGWFQSPYSKNWYYFNNDGKAASGFKQINNQTFYFDPSNVWTDTGWQQINGYWYFFDPNHDGNYGAAKTGWFQSPSSKNWYYFDQSGRAVTGFQSINNREYYFDLTNANMKVGCGST